MKLFFFIYVLGIICLPGFLFQNTKLEESMKRGSGIYADFCINCHLEKGEGVPNVFPPLANSDYLKTKRYESISGIKYGQRGKIIVNGETYDNIMMPLGLEDGEVADVMNYILNSWGNTSETLVTPNEVAEVKEK